ncbi:ImmA/IrrE family metallo-endopeptidase [Corynebacterium kefirresidentii]|uniref:ImmA/IrrE family metallo-endopeptidase n=1 Tax=Corynebacterium kefirresidentii TaxID=1979527 RepID=UPI0038D03179
MIEALIQAAEARGYRIRWHRGGPKAAWLPHRNTISLRVGMDDTTTLCSLAHELGHAHYNDPPGHYGAHELRADRFAARLLVAPGDYAAAEGVYGSHPAVLAAELGVTVKIINVWQELHTRRAAPLAG